MIDNDKKNKVKNRSKLIKKLNEVGHRSLDIITISGITVCSICYTDAIQDEEDKDIIYLRIGTGIESDMKDIYINYRAIKYIREFSDCIEITV